MGRIPAAGLGACRASDQLKAGRDVAPLVGAAALQLDPVRATQVGEVGCLEKHVAELGEGESLRQSRLHRILLEHVRDREVLAHVPQEVEQPHLAQPVQVVDDEGLGRRRG